MNIEYQTGELTINPKLTLSKSGGTKYTNNGTCYTGTITINATCSSMDEISSFTPSNATYNDTKTSASGSVEAYSANMTCTTIYGTSATASASYKKCTYSRHKSCGVDHYNYSGSFTCYSINGANSYKLSCNSSTYGKSAAKACGTHSGQDFGSCSRSAVYKKCYHA